MTQDAGGTQGTDVDEASDPALEETTSGRCPKLRPAAGLDATERLDAYFDALAAKGGEVGFDQSSFVKAMVADAVDAMGPSLLALHDAVAAAPRAIPGTALLDLGVRFVHALTITAADRVLAIAVETEAPTGSSPAMEAMIAAEEASMADGRDTPIEALTNRILAEMRVEERCQAEGWPDDFADAARGRIKRVFAVLDGEARAVPAMRTLAQGKWHHALFDARPAFDFRDGGWSHSDPNVSDPCDWSEAFAMLRGPLAQAGLLAGLGERAEALSHRAYNHYGDPGDEGDKALHEAAHAVAGMDGGLPGEEATAFVAAFEGRAAATKLAPAVRLAAFLRGAGHGADHDNGDGVARLDLLPDGSEAITLTHYDETYVLALATDGGTTRVGASRQGVSLDLGLYAVAADGAASCLRAHPYTTRCVRDVSKIDTLMGSAFCIDLQERG